LKKVLTIKLKTRSRVPRLPQPNFLKSNNSFRSGRVLAGDFLETEIERGSSKGSDGLAQAPSSRVICQRILRTGMETRFPRRWYDRSVHRLKKENPRRGPSKSRAKSKKPNSERFIISIKSGGRQTGNMRSCFLERWASKTFAVVQLLSLGGQTGLRSVWPKTGKGHWLCWGVCPMNRYCQTNRRDTPQRWGKLT